MSKQINISKEEYDRLIKYKQLALVLHFYPECDAETVLKRKKLIEDLISEDNKDN